MRKVWEEDERLGRKYIEIGYSNDLEKLAAERDSNPDIVSWTQKTYILVYGDINNSNDLDKWMAKYGFGGELFNLKRKIHGKGGPLEGFFAVSEKEREGLTYKINEVILGINKVNLDEMVNLIKLFATYSNKVERPEYYEMCASIEKEIAIINAKKDVDIEKEKTKRETMRTDIIQKLLSCNNTEKIEALSKFLN